MPGRREEAGQVEGHAAAQRHDDKVSTGPLLQEPVLEARLGLARLVALSGGKSDERGSNASSAEQPNETPAMEASHPSIRDDDVGGVGEDPREMSRG